MTAETLDTPQPLLPATYPYVFILALWLAGMLLLRPFVPVLMAAAGAKSAALAAARPWTVSILPLGLLLIGCFLHRRSGLPALPLVKWLVTPRQYRGPRPSVWRPGFIAAIITLAILALGSLLEGMLHRQAPLFTRLASGDVPHALLLHVVAIAPVGALAAGLNEEALFRFAVMSILMGLLSFAYRSGGHRSSAIAFWIVNIVQAVYFGYGHVASGIVASSVGGIVLQTVTASQTWAGLVLGYVYRRWGLETAMFTHFVADTVALGGLALCALV